MNYFYYIEDNNIKYTIDMLRLSCKISNNNANDIITNLRLENNVDYFYNSSFKIGTYAHNFTFDNFWLGIGCKNSEYETKEQLITLEFNPNKANLENSFFNYFINSYKDKIIIKRFDLSIDIKENILNLNFENLNKRSSTIYYQYNDNKTIYFGKGNGHTKIYNKKIESNLDYELTRYEVTKELDNVYFKDINLVGILNFNFISPIILPYNEKSKNKTYNAIAYALNRGFHFKDLSRDMQRNIRENQVYNIEFKNDIASKCLIDTISLLYAKK